MKPEGPVGVNEGDGTVKCPPLSCTVCGGTQRVQKSYSRLSGSYHCVCGFSGSFSAAVIVGILRAWPELLAVLVLGHGIVSMLRS